MKIVFETGETLVAQHNLEPFKKGEPFRIAQVPQGTDESTYYVVEFLTTGQTHQCIEVDLRHALNIPSLLSVLAGSWLQVNGGFIRQTGEGCYEVITYEVYDNFHMGTKTVNGIQVTHFNIDLKQWTETEDENHWLTQSYMERKAGRIVKEDTDEEIDVLSYGGYERFMAYTIARGTTAGSGDTTRLCSGSDQLSEFLSEFGVPLEFHTKQDMKFTSTFNSPYTDHQHRIGNTFKVIGEKDRSTYDFEEVGVMYCIEFQDGEQIDAYPEEVVEEWVNYNKHAMLLRTDRSSTCSDSDILEE
jgi:hypothetical protein